MSILSHEILIESDMETEDLYAIWEAGSAIGMGMTKREALDDLRETIHLYIDTMVDAKLQEANHNMLRQGGRIA